MNFNLHTHTPRCHHAVGSEREYVEQAIAAGLKTLGFSDHSPMPFADGYCSSFRMQVSEVDGYINTLLALRDEYRDQIDLKIGFEAEYYPAVFPSLIRLLRDYPVDYLILGQHFTNNERDGSPSGKPTEDEQELIRYVDQTAEALQTGKYTYFAHPDMKNFVGSDAVYEKHMSRLCENAKSLGIPLEINMLGLWESRHYPSDRFFRIAAEVGNDIVIGVDAHQPERILEADVYEKALAMIERCGLKQPLQQIQLRNPRG